MKDKILKLIDALMFVENKRLKQTMLEAFIRKNGDIPDEYKDAVDAVMEM